jgi:hypothetical protein
VDPVRSATRPFSRPLVLMSELMASMALTASLIIRVLEEGISTKYSGASPLSEAGAQLEFARS